MGRLTTHVLDTARGKPAAGLEIELWADEKRLKTIATNADGRADAPLLEGEAFKPGTYELRFKVADYAAGFYDVIPVRFVVADASQHYHVPLLLSPYGYSTYRGS